MDLSQNKILLLPTCKSVRGELITIENIYNIITSFDFYHSFIDLRDIYNKYITAKTKEEAKEYEDSYRNIKKTLVFAQYGTAPRDKSRNTPELSGFMYIDFDAKDNTADADEIKEMLCDNYNNIVLCYKSASNYGVSAVFWFGEYLTQENFAAIYHYLAFEINQKFDFVADEKCSNWNRGSFISSDLQVYYNPKAVTPDTQEIIYKANIFLHGKEKKEQKFYIDSTQGLEKDILATVAYCKKNDKYLITNYNEWINVLSVIVKHFSDDLEKCYHLAHQVSSINAEKYDKEATTKKVGVLIKKNLNKITEKTFYYYAKQAGYNIYKEKKGDISYNEFRNLIRKTDTELVIYLIDKIFNNDIIFNVTCKEYMFYKDGVWKKDESFKMNQVFDKWLNVTKQTLIEEINEEVNHMTEDEKEEQKDQIKQKFTSVVNFWERFRTVRNNKAIASHFENINDIRKSETLFDSHNYLICLQNGVYDFKNHVFIQHNKKLLFTKTLKFNYDVYADCPKFLEFLKQIFGDDTEYIDFFQKFIGLCLTGRTDLFQGVVFMYGSGSNGKSLFMNIIKEFLSEFAAHISSDLIIERKGFGVNEDYEKASLLGKRIVTISEIPTVGKMKENVIKDLTGGDEIKSRQIREKVLSFKPTFKVLMAGNHKPYVQGNDEGIWRRFFLVSFNRTFSENESRPEQEIMKEIKEEFPGIFNWALKGYRELEKEGRLKMTEKMKKDVAEYRSTQSTLYEFLTTYFKPQEGGRVLRDDAYNDYKQYCHDNNLSLKDIFSKEKFARHINNSYFGTLKLSIKRIGERQVKYIENIRKMTVEERENIDVQTHEELEFDIKEASEVPF